MEKKTQVFASPELFRILKEIDAVTSNEVAAHSQTLSPLQPGDTTIRKLDLYAKKVAVLLIRKTHLAEEAAESGDTANADRLGNEMSLLDAVLSYLVNVVPMPNPKRRMGKWGIRQGFMLVLQKPDDSRNGDELEVEFVPEGEGDMFDEFDEFDEPAPYSPPIDKKKLN